MLGVPNSCQGEECECKNLRVTGLQIIMDGMNDNVRYVTISGESTGWVISFR